MEGNVRHDVMLIVLNRLKNHIDGNIEALLSKELKTLLKWKGIQVSKIGDKAGYHLRPLQGQAEEECCAGMQEDDARGEGGSLLSDQQDGRICCHSHCRCRHRHRQK